MTFYEDDILFFLLVFLVIEQGGAWSLGQQLFGLLDDGEDPGLPLLRPVGAHAQAHLLGVPVSLQGKSHSFLLAEF